MSLVVAATYGSLPEASIAFSSLEAEGFHPVAGFNMNTPGAADGMAPSAYRVLIPESEAEAARAFLQQVFQTLSVADQPDGEDDDGPSRTTLGGFRRVVRIAVIGALALWALWFLILIRGCA